MVHLTVSRPASGDRKRTNKMARPADPTNSRDNQPTDSTQSILELARLHDQERLTQASTTPPATHLPTFTASQDPTQPHATTPRPQATTIYHLLTSVTPEQLPPHGFDGILSSHLSINSAINQATILLNQYETALTVSPQQATTFLRRILPYRQLHAGIYLSTAPLNKPYMYTPRKLIHPQINYGLSDPAYDSIHQQAVHYQYNGHSATTGHFSYLKALLDANPTTPLDTPLDDPRTRSLELKRNPTSKPRPHASVILTPLLNWHDARPDYLTTMDAPRLYRNKWPLWYPGDYNPRRRARYVSTAKYNAVAATLLQLADHFLIASRSHQEDQKARAMAVVEAIGLGYLIPRNAPAYNPKPINPKRKYKKRFELVF